MTVLRKPLLLVKSTISNQSNSIHYLGLLKKNLLMASVGFKHLSSVEVTKNLEIITADKNKKVSNLRLVSAEQKPLVVLLSWLLAKRNHIYKYANFYADQGFDVLNVSITPWQLLWPAKGTQVIAKDVVKFLDINKEYSPLFIHGFSVGGYMWGEVLVELAREQKRYQHIVDRVAGQVWDSAADVTEIPVGLPTAVFPKNAVMQAALRQYTLYHMKTFHKVATTHYLRSSQMFHTNLIHAPALFLLSKIDPVGSESSNQSVREDWENMGMEVYWKCWNDSRHVSHFHKHPKEYMAELYTFMDRLGLISCPEKIRAKL